MLLLLMMIIIIIIIVMTTTATAMVMLFSRMDQNITLAWPSQWILGQARPRGEGTYRRPVGKTTAIQPNGRTDGRTTDEKRNIIQKRSEVVCFSSFNFFDWRFSPEKSWPRSRTRDDIQFILLMLFVTYLFSSQPLLGRCAVIRVPMPIGNCSLVRPCGVSLDCIARVLRSFFDARLSPFVTGWNPAKFAPADRICLRARPASLEPL